MSIAARSKSLGGGADVWANAEHAISKAAIIPMRNKHLSTRGASGPLCSGPLWAKGLDLNWVSLLAEDGCGEAAEIAAEDFKTVIVR